MDRLWRTLAVAGFVGAMAAPVPAFAQDSNSVEVLHFFTSGSEAKAFYQFKDQFEAAGGKWIDSPVAGGGGDSHDTTLRARVLAGDGPGAAMPKCPEAARWYKEGYIVNIDDVAAANDWDNKLPGLVKSFAKVDDHYVCVPFDIHRIDWLWGNADVLSEAGVAEMPKTWEEFDAAAAKIKAKGKIVLAAGGQEWQDGTIFQAVAMGIGGPAYLSKLAEGDDATIRSDTTRKVFDRMRILSTDLDPGYPNREWNLTSALVTKGDAAFQIMGDWAKGEFLLSGKKMATSMTPGAILCAPVPGDKPDRTGVVMVSNALAFFTKTKGDTAATPGQKLLAKTLLSPDAELAYTQYKGSIPAIMGVDPSLYDACAQKSMADVAAANKDNSLVGDLYTMFPTPPAITAAVREVASKHFNTPDMSSDDAITALADAVDLAK